MEAVWDLEDEETRRQRGEGRAMASAVGDPLKRSPKLRAHLNSCSHHHPPHNPRRLGCTLSDSDFTNHPLGQESQGKTGCGALR
jgi:hypothetical protein